VRLVACTKWSGSAPTATTATCGGVPYLDNPFGRSADVHRGVGGRELDIASGKPGSGRELDRAAGKNIGVHGTGKIEVDFKNMPDGVSGKAEAGGLFKDTAVSTQRQMAPAKSGETKSANASMEECGKRVARRTAGQRPFGVHSISGPAPPSRRRRLKQI
jgi:hypothetical protein